jgi:hypothetical protein
MRHSTLQVYVESDQQDEFHPNTDSRRDATRISEVSMMRIASALRIALAFTYFSVGSAAGAPALAQGSGTLTNPDVVKLSEAGVGEAIIIQTINRAAQTKFDTSADALVQLKKSGITDSVLAAMLAAKTVVAPETALPIPVSRSPVRTLQGGILDEMALYVEMVPSRRVAIRPFSASDTDIVKGEKKDETKTLQADGPRVLAERLAAKLKELGPFTDVTIITKDDTVPEGAVVVEGSFTELDPGSRAKRYFVGFGSGKSAITVKGTVKSADGAVLATFQHRRIGVMGMGGGDSLGKLVSDTKNLGEDVAKFMSAWASGKKLK